MGTVGGFTVKCQHFDRISLRLARCEPVRPGSDPSGDRALLAESFEVRTVMGLWRRREPIAPGRVAGLAPRLREGGA
ncbi:hypothetical protein KNE206_63440 [Kitasatospora sp. NE20-6]